MIRVSIESNMSLLSSTVLTTEDLNISHSGVFGREFRRMKEMLRETYSFVGRAELDCLEGGTHEETLCPQVNPKV